MIPPTTLVGLKESADRGGPTVSNADWLPPPYVAVIETLVGVVTALLVPTVKGALVAPPGTGILAGTVASERLLLARPTVTPLPGAGAAKVTVPCELLPPGTVVGFSVTEAKRGPTVSAAV